MDQTWRYREGKLCIKSAHEYFYNISHKDLVETRIPTKLILVTN